MKNLKSSHLPHTKQYRKSKTAEQIKYILSFLAVQTESVYSSIGDLVTDWLYDSLTHTLVDFGTYFDIKEWPKLETFETFDQGDE